jgi:predicted RNA-binding protein with PIN domain
MNEDEIIDVWNVFKEFLDKKHVELAAEKYVDTLADYGVSDQTLIECFGSDSNLDAAIKYYLDLDADEEDDPWDSED